MKNEKIELAVEVLRRNILTTFGTYGMNALIFVKRNPQKATECHKLVAQEVRELCREPYWADAVIIAEVERQCWCHCHVRIEAAVTDEVSHQCWCACQEYRE